MVCRYRYYYYLLNREHNANIHRRESHTTLDPSNTRPQFTLFIFSLRHRSPRSSSRLQDALCLVMLLRLHILVRDGF